MDNIIYFDGTTCKLMDPTFAVSGGQSAEIMQYIGTVSYTQLGYKNLTEGEREEILKAIEQEGRSWNTYKRS